MLVVAAVMLLLGAATAVDVDAGTLQTAAIYDTFQKFDSNVWQFRSPTVVSAAGGGVWWGPAAANGVPVNVQFGQKSSAKVATACSGGLAMHAVDDLCTKNLAACKVPNAAGVPTQYHIAGAFMYSKAQFLYGKFETRAQSDHSSARDGACTQITSYFDVYGPSGAPTINVAWNCDGHQLQLVTQGTTTAASKSPHIYPNFARPLRQRCVSYTIIWEPEQIILEVGGKAKFRTIDKTKIPTIAMTVGFNVRASNGAHPYNAKTFRPTVAYFHSFRYTPYSGTPTPAPAGKIPGGAANDKAEAKADRKERGGGKGKGKGRRGGGKKHRRNRRNGKRAGVRPPKKSGRRGGGKRRHGKK